MFQSKSDKYSIRISKLTVACCAVLLSVNAAHAEHCFAPNTSWLQDANTSKQGYWKFVPSPGPMGISEALPITCMQQDLRFVEDDSGGSIAFENPQSVAAEKCFNVIKANTKITWDSGWQDEFADWGVSLNAGDFSRLFAIKCTVRQGGERKIHLSSQLIPGKSGRVEYVWRQTQ